MDYLTKAVHLLLDGPEEERLDLRDLCIIADAYYKANYIDVVHCDRLISYLTRNDYLNK